MELKVENEMAALQRMTIGQLRTHYGEAFGVLGRRSGSRAGLP